MTVFLTATGRSSIFTDFRYPGPAQPSIDRRPAPRRLLRCEFSFFSSSARVDLTSRLGEILPSWVAAVTSFTSRGGCGPLAHNWRRFAESLSISWNAKGTRGVLIETRNLFQRTVASGACLKLL